MKDYFVLTRPFTLIYPFFGIACAASCAVEDWDKRLLGLVILCAMGASMLNAASNVLNQISDIDIDKINKPDRPLSRGSVEIKKAKTFMTFLYFFSVLIFYLVDYLGGHQTLLIGLITVFMTYVYSYGPRTKEHWIFSNVTISITRGFLLTLMGWTTVNSSQTIEAVYIGSIWSIFLFGAAYTKDFSDMEGDAKYNCNTLPIKFGVKKAAWFIAPFLTLPFMLFSVYRYFGTLTGNYFILTFLSLILTLWGAYISFLILRNPQAMTKAKTHPSWIHMYLLMIIGQSIQALAYIY